MQSAREGFRPSLYMSYIVFPKKQAFQELPLPPQQQRAAVQQSDHGLDSSSTDLGFQSDDLSETRFPTKQVKQRQKKKSTFSCKKATSRHNSPAALGLGKQRAAPQIPRCRINKAGFSPLRLLPQGDPPCRFLAMSAAGTGYPLPT